MSSKLKLILASTSPRRKELLGHLKLPFEIITKEVPEESLATNPMQFCLEIAKLKGDAVFHELSNTRAHEGLFVVSADTIVSLENRIYGKPRDRQEARSFLRDLSGRTHSVFTAVAVKVQHQKRTEEFAFVDESRVSFNPIDDFLMERYLDTGDSLDKAGAYGIQGPSLTFISRIEGSYSNVVGFPLSRFIVESEKFLKTFFPNEASWLTLFQ